MAYERKVVSITTDAGGAGSGSVEIPIGAKLDRICYVADGSNPYANTVDFTITLEATGETLWSEANIAATKTVAPRQPTHTSAAAAALYAAAGQAVLDKISIVRDRILITLAQGGATKSGSFHFILE